MKWWIENEFYRISTPTPSPRPFGGFTWLAAKAGCKRCGREYTQALRIHKVILPDFSSDLAIKKDMPSEEKIATSFMVRVCDNAVGCWSNCTPERHLKICQLPSKRLLLAHDPHRCFCPKSVECTCTPGCGNKNIHPCSCGKMFAKQGGKHNHGCPTGLFKRVSSFSLEYLRSQMLYPRGR